MSYKYIKISAVPAPLIDVITDGSDYNVGVKAETNLANAAEDLLAACIEATSLFDNYPELYEQIGTWQVLISAINKAQKGGH